MCLLFSVISCLIYLRFGYLYAILIEALVPICMIPFQLSLSTAVERVVLFFVLCGILIFNLIVDKRENEIFRKDRYTIMQACLLVAIYLTVNLQIPGLADGLSEERGYSLFSKKYSRPIFTGCPTF